ncbi:MAG: glutamate-1-semialdehyde 2,1-aminomutase [Verrucomicrobiota bacterium]
MARPKSETLFAEALQYLPGGVNSPVRAFRAVGGHPFFAVRAEGPRVYDLDGNDYIDYVCTWGPAILGHAPAVVVEAIQDAATRGASFGIPNPDEVEMARLICDWVPSVGKVRMTNSGTEATMSAIRLARGYTGRDRLIKFTGCYHGHVDSLLVKAGSGALTLGAPDSAGVPAALAGLTSTLPFNDLEAVRATLEEYRGEVAAIILEPIPANAGLILPEPGYLEGLRKLCDEHQTVLIFDEVMTGFRLGQGGVQVRLGVTPDLSCFGKVIGGGLPVGALGGKEEIMDCLAPLGPVYQAGTLSGNPLAMAAGLAQLRALAAGGVFVRLEELGEMLREGLEEILRRRQAEMCLHQVGSMFCLFSCPGPVRNLEEAMRADRDAFARVFHRMLEAGVYLAPSQFETGFISAAHTEAEIEATLRAFDEALAADG